MQLKHIIIGAVLISLVIILALPTGEVAVPVEMQDCGNSMACLEMAAQNCTPAKVVQDTEATSTYMEIRGKRQGKCNVFIRIDSVNGSAAEMGYYPESLQQSVLSWQGKDMACLVPMEGAVYEPVNLTRYCEGGLKDAILSTSRKMGAFYKELAAVNPACVEGTLWDYNEISYIIHGIEDGRCHATYTFEIPPVVGEVSVDHYFTLEDVSANINYSSAPLVEGDIRELCRSANKWSHRDAYGSAQVTLATVASDTNSTYCHLVIDIHPTSPYLPGATADIFVSETGETSILLETTGGIVVEKSYAPVK